jgi:MHS family alpha-ketoglutarate permease-like MFS transporter
MQPPAAASKSAAYYVRSIIGGSIGNLIEWYDWYTYAVFSLYFAGTFFPKDNETAQLLNTAGIFAIGFLMRPVGGWLMGAYADRKGRKSALTFSVLLMSSGSLIITFVPGYQFIGIAAPMILVVARMLQGLSIGGEYGTAATYLSEMAPPKLRGFYSSFQYVTSIMGQLIALGILILLQRYLLSPNQLISWGWRIPFAIGGLFSLSAIYLRRGLEETSYFTREKAAITKRGTFAELVKYKREVLTVIGFTAGFTLCYYTLTVYMQKFLVNTAGFSKNDSSLINVIILFVFMLAQPLAGWLGDVYNRRRIMIVYGVLATLTTVPIMLLVGATHQFWVATGLLVIGVLILSLNTSISAILKAEMFPAHIRSLGVSFPYALAVALFGGSAEFIALLFKNTGHAGYFYWYLTAFIILSLVVSIKMKDTGKFSKMDEVV